MRTVLFVFLLLLLWTACTIREETVSFDPSLELVFSTDTVAFDTLLSGQRSSTRRMTVYNPNKSAIQISEILLGKGTSSDYTAVINGKEQNVVQNERLLGGDSLLILVDVTIRPRDENLPYPVKDSLVFKWNGNETHVKLVAYGQDVHTIQSQRLCNTTWTKERPYFVDGIVEVSTGCTLTIEEGTKVYFFNDALLVVAGSLVAIGDTSDQILFSSWRFDSGYSNAPGQWSGIIFLEESTNNELVHCTIENADIAVGLGYQIKENSLLPGDVDNLLQSDISIENTLIRNAATAGLLAFHSKVDATNLLIYNCGTFLVGNFAGGDYRYRHCTFSNEPSLFIQNDPTIQFADNAVVGESVLVADMNVELVNNILWGVQKEELLISNAGGASITTTLMTNIIRSEQEIANNYTSQERNFPGFMDVFGYDYRLDTLAFAKDKGVLTGVTQDILGKNRDSLPDIGAYERIEE